MYTPNVSNCLFNFTLQGNDDSLLGSIGVLVVARNGKNKTYSVSNLPQYLNFMSAPLRLCTPAGVDIQTIVSAELEEMNELIVMEVLDTTSDCENGESTHVKYFGRSARLIFNSLASGECVQKFITGKECPTSRTNL